MKKIFIICAMMIACVACGNTTTKHVDTTDVDTTNVVTEVVENVDSTTTEIVTETVTE